MKDMGSAGWLAAFVYCAATGIRLARFNVNIGVVDKHFFQGLPSPSGAAVLAGLVWVMTDFDFQPDTSIWLAGVTWIVALFAGITMVSNVPFYSFKEFNWKRRVPLWAILAAVIAYSVVASKPSLVLFLLSLSYAVSGYVMWAMGRRGRPGLPEKKIPGKVVALQKPLFPPPLPSPPPPPPPPPLPTPPPPPPPSPLP